MKITLKPEQEKFIAAQVTSGKYPSAEEVIAAALALLADSSEPKESNTYQQWVEEMRPKVAIGIAQLDRSEGIDGETVVARLQEKFRKIRENKR